MKAAIVHGGDLKIVKNAHPDVHLPWIDLSTGLNPVPYPWQEKISESELARSAAALPQEERVEACVEAWTRYLKVKAPGEWVLTAGSQALINLLPQLLPEYQVIIPEPSYGEHERVWCRRDRKPVMVPRAQFMRYRITKKQVVILTSPNNPDGYIWPPELILSLAEELAEKNGYLVLDEAFADVAGATSLAAETLPESLILLRSFGKFFGLAGLRLGLARIPRHLHQKVRALLGPWAVNGLAAVIAEHALGDIDWIRSARAQLSLSAKRLRAIVEQTGGRFVGGSDLFVLTEFDDAQAIVRRLNGQAIHVRSFEKYPNWLRFGLPADNVSFERLKEALHD